MLSASVRFLLVCWLAFPLLLNAAPAADQEPRPYQSDLDVNAAIAAALEAGTSARPLLLIFGANWCPDSRALEAHFQRAELAGLLQREFRVLYVDVGTFHRNLDVAERYGNPIDKGIPSVALLGADGSLLYTGHGQLAGAKAMSEQEVLDFFSGLAARQGIE